MKFLTILLLFNLNVWANPVIENGVFPADLRSQSVFGVNKEVQVYFSIPPYTDPGQIGPKKGLLNFIRNAKKSLRLAMFQINDPDIFLAIGQSIKSGVEVTIALESCYRNAVGYKEFVDDIEVVYRSAGKDPKKYISVDGSVTCSGQFQHNKYAISDFENKAATSVWVGSYNPTAHGEFENVEISFHIKNPQLALVLYLDHQQMMKGIFQNQKMGVYQINNKYRLLSDQEVIDLALSGVQVDTPKISWGEGEQKFELDIIITPKTKSIRKLIEHIYRAKKEIVFSAFALGDSMIVSSLINKSGKGRGFPTEVVALRSYPWENDGLFLRNSNNDEQTLWEWSSSQRTPPEAILTNLVPLAQNVFKQNPAYTVYLKDENTFKKTYNRIYSYGSQAGALDKVYVEGIFNSRISDKQSTFDRLNKNGISVFRSTLNGELHNKYFIIDREILVFGSHNFSQSADNTNDEVIIFMKNKNLASFVHKYFYQNTKLFTEHYIKNQKLDYSKATVAITEVHAESEYILEKNEKPLDAGEYVELYNYGDRPVNLYGFRLADHYFPNKSCEQVPSGYRSGYSNPIVGFKPPVDNEVFGKPIFSAQYTTLKPKRFALIVGRAFRTEFVRQRFVINFRQKYGRAPLSDEYPLLLTSGRFNIPYLGDAKDTISFKDKLTIYGLDSHSVVDRFEYPPKLINPSRDDYSGISLERINRSFETNEVFEFVSRTILYGQKEEQHLFYGRRSSYSNVSDWYLDHSNIGGTPGW